MTLEEIKENIKFSTHKLDPNTLKIRGMFAIWQEIEISKFELEMTKNPDMVINEAKKMLVTNLLFQLSATRRSEFISALHEFLMLHSPYHGQYDKANEAYRKLANLANFPPL